MMGRWLKISISTSPANKRDTAPRKQGLSDKPEGCTSVFVGNLSWQASEDDLRSCFESCGEVINCRIAMDQETGRSKGFGHVDFNETDATDAAVKLTGTDVAGRAIRVDFAGNRAPGGAGGGARGGRGGGRGGFTPRGGRGAPRGGRGGFGSASSTPMNKNKGSIVPGQGKKVTFD